MRATPPENLSSDLVTALGAAGAWTVIDVARAWPAPSLASTVPALLGSASLLLGVAIVAARRAWPPGDGLRAVVLGALVASFPLAFVAATLERVTHHRALGGVTFAFVALVVVAGSSAVAWRLLRAARDGARVARAALLAAAVASSGAVVLALVLHAGVVSSSSLGAGVVDAAIGVVLLVSALAVVRRVALGPSRVGAVAWVCVVAASVVMTALDPSMCAGLAARDPVAFALGVGCGG
ncbi:MAG TPA: hypothetical protein VH062_20280 [Polyangiaceae bacterium]|nr:hypothetical protein [Polyangiaceae bacterium]